MSVRGAQLTALVWCALSAQVLAQPTPEPVDPTRLDVERLPPEAIELSRDMFSRGPYLSSTLGSRGFLGGVGRVAGPGLFASIALGYELASWVSFGALVETSLHRTDGPAPPSPGGFEVFDALAEARLTWPMSARAALWLAGQGGVGFASSDLLRVYGIDEADNLALVYGGSLGFDWHLLTRHHSFGLQAGARLHPGLDDGAGERAIAVHGAAYLKYVF